MTADRRVQCGAIVVVENSGNLEIGTSHHGGIVDETEDGPVVRIQRADRKDLLTALASLEQVDQQPIEVRIPLPIGIVQVIATELVEHAHRRGAELGGGEPLIGTALAAALVYFARQCGLTDENIHMVLSTAMSETARTRIGPPKPSGTA